MGLRAAVAIFGGWCAPVLAQQAQARSDFFTTLSWLCLAFIENN